jgi:hypothetical protein
LIDERKTPVRVSRQSAPVNVDIEDVFRSCGSHTNGLPPRSSRKDDDQRNREHGRFTRTTTPMNNQSPAPMNKISIPSLENWKELRLQAEKTPKAVVIGLLTGQLIRKFRVYDSHLRANILFSINDIDWMMKSLEINKFKVNSNCYIASGQFSDGMDTHRISLSTQVCEKFLGISSDECRKLLAGPPGTSESQRKSLKLEFCKKFMSFRGVYSVEVIFEGSLLPSSTADSDGFNSVITNIDS